MVGKAPAPRKREKPRGPERGAYTLAGEGKGPSLPILSEKDEKGKVSSRPLKEATFSISRGEDHYLKQQKGGKSIFVRRPSSLRKKPSFCGNLFPERFPDLPFL